MEKRKISAKEILLDINSGMSTSDLMEKHRVSELGLKRALDKLSKARLISDKRLKPLLADLSAVEETDKSRQEVECHTIVRLPIYDLDDIEAVGDIIEITENNVRVVGIDAGLGDTKTFLVQTDNVSTEIPPLSFDAECVLHDVDPETSRIISDCAISNISDENRKTLNNLVSLITICD
jgi:hypothetical protein